VSVSGVGALARYFGANATSRTAQPSPHGGAPGSAFITLPGDIRSAARRKGHGAKMTRTKSRRRFPSDGCPGPLGDPLVCAPFLDDGMIRVQLNQASSQRIESAGQHQSCTAPSPSPLAGSEASEARSRGQGGGSTSRAGSKVHKPHLDEMHGLESLPYRPGRSKPSRDDAGPGTGSKIFQPTDSRQSGPEFGPSPRSSGGAPGHRGGWKKR
jgi:hypothetical protein